MNRAVAIATKINGFPMLFACVILFEPAILVASSWNQVMLGRARFKSPPAKLAWFLLMVLVTHPVLAGDYFTRDKIFWRLTFANQMRVAFVKQHFRSHWF